MVKGIADILFLILCAGFVWFGDVCVYLIKQGAGQADVILNTESRESYLSKPGIPSHHAERLMLVDEVRAFAFDSLGLKRNKSYLKVYDQQGEPLLWVITASPRYSLSPKTWTFPIVGTVSYTGYFKKSEAEKVKVKLESAGFDVHIREVNAWSTLGYLADPILSEMLNEPVGRMVNTIIHELSHGTIFIRSNVDESENLASFIGDVGAEMFLAQRFGKESYEYFEYVTQEEDFGKLTTHFLRGAQRLDSLYASPDFQNLSETEKEAEKSQCIKTIMADMDTLTFHIPGRFQKLKTGNMPNNAFFIQFRQYGGLQNHFYEEFNKDFNGDLRSYIQELRKRY
ncbi:MAG: aminopeptidase [Flavobacteriales bacterium]|nr:aminopeptidase [Flavobacteriales bacterium]